MGNLRSLFQLLGRVMPTFATVSREITAFGAQLDEAMCANPERFWEALRATSIPYIPTYFRSEPDQGHRLASAALREIGRKNIGLGYALENHLFVVGGMETYLSLHPNELLRSLLDQACELRQFIANTHGYVHADRAFSEGLSVRRAPGGLFIDGQGTFLSLAGTADWLLLLLDGTESVALFFPIKGDASIRLGGLSFPKILVESDTRGLRCEGTFVPQELNLPIPPEHLASGGAFATSVLAWHLSLCACQFLGGVSHLVDHTLHFARKFKSFDNRPLERLDGVVAEIGQIGLRVGAIEAMIGEVSRALAITPPAGNGSFLPELLFRAQVANHLGMELIEEVSRRCRRILGTRLFSSGAAPFDRITTELLLGPLVPRNNSLLERDVGHALLARELAP